MTAQNRKRARPVLLSSRILPCVCAAYALLASAGFAQNTTPAPEKAEEEALPNRTDINPRALNTNAPQSIDNNDAGIRLEQDGPRDHLIFGYNSLSQTVDAFQLVAGQNPDTRTKSQRARTTWIRQLSPETILSLSAGFDRIGSLLVPEENSVGPMVLTAGLTTLGPQAIIPIDRAQNIYRYEGQVRRGAGNHNWTAGFYVIRRQLDGTETDAHRGVYSFSNDFGRTGIENLRLGTPSS